MRTSLPESVSDIMLNAGTTPKPYEPYGYYIPVTIITCQNPYTMQQETVIDTAHRGYVPTCR